MLTHVDPCWPILTRAVQAAVALQRMLRPGIVGDGDGGRVCHVRRRGRDVPWRPPLPRHGLRLLHEHGRLHIVLCRVRVLLLCTCTVGVPPFPVHRAQHCLNV